VYFETHFTEVSKHIIMHSLHDVHEMNTYRAGHVCLSVRMIQLENYWFNLDEIWCGCYATGDYQYHTFQFPAIGNTIVADKQTCEVGSTLAPLTVWPYNDVWL
jgi:hypothetical protein